jgi:hypothetical protein
MTLVLEVNVQVVAVVKALPPVTSMSMTSPDFPLADEGVTVSVVACALGTATDDIETNNAEESRRTRYKELLERLVKSEHASLILQVWAI